MPVAPADLPTRDILDEVLAVLQRYVSLTTAQSVLSVARQRGGLAVTDFLKIISVQQLSKPALKRLAPAITTLARAEGLEAHARSVEVRIIPGRDRQGAVGARRGRRQYQGDPRHKGQKRSGEPGRQPM